MRAKQQRVRKLGSCAQFAARVYFWPCEQCFNNLHQGAKICSYVRGRANLFAPGFKFAPSANCAHERTKFNFYTF